MRAEGAIPSREAIHKAPDAPATPLQRAVSYLLVSVIVLSIVGLVVYVLGGMYFLIEDIDRPIDHQRIALIDADLSPLRVLNQTWSDAVR